MSCASECDAAVKMHLPYESRGRRRREMAELEPWWLQSIIDDTLVDHPDLGKILLIFITLLFTVFAYTFLLYCDITNNK